MQGSSLDSDICQCGKEEFRAACYGFAHYEHEGKRYCILHLPSENKEDDFKEALEYKFKQLLHFPSENKEDDFEEALENIGLAGVYFPRDFSGFAGVTFREAVDFSEATFSEGVGFTGATFSEGANFYNATFSGDVNFSRATFKGGANFVQATFKGNAHFASFEESGFVSATFEGYADFTGATFGKGAYFSYATFSEEVNFSAARFSEEASFREATFSKRADFSYATFSGRADFFLATFSNWAGFSGATFSGGADFSGATFSGGANFIQATFSEAAEFGAATFSGVANFSSATFTESLHLNANFVEAAFSEKAWFQGVTFSKGANFSLATFSEEVRFYGATFSKYMGFHGATFKESAIFTALKAFPRTMLVFRDANIEKPERIFFHTTFLRPSWFVDVDAQKFDFSDVEWFRIPDASKPNTDQLKPLTLENEIANLVVDVEGQPEDKTSWDQGSRARSLHKLTKACRRLMNNAEENRDYPTANEMHYWSMEAQRKEGWSRLGLIATLYWALSGYGERPRRAFSVLVTIWLAFAALYFLVVASSPFWVFSASDVWQGIDYGRQAVVYSLSALARLNPRPESEELDWFQTLVTLEGILGPLQIALFLLAVRRKVMR